MVPPAGRPHRRGRNSHPLPASAPTFAALLRRRRALRHAPASQVYEAFMLNVSQLSEQKIADRAAWAALPAWAKDYVRVSEPPRQPSLVGCSGHRAFPFRGRLSCLLSAWHECGDFSSAARIRCFAGVPLLAVLISRNPRPPHSVEHLTRALWLPGSLSCPQRSFATGIIEFGSGSLYTSNMIFPSAGIAPPPPPAPRPRARTASAASSRQGAASSGAAAPGGGKQQQAAAPAAAGGAAASAAPPPSPHDPPLPPPTRDAAGGQSAAASSALLRRSPSAPDSAAAAASSAASPAASPAAAAAIASSPFSRQRFWVPSQQHAPLESGWSGLMMDLRGPANNTERRQVQDLVLATRAPACSDLILAVRAGRERRGSYAQQATPCRQGITHENPVQVLCSFSQVSDAYHNVTSRASVQCLAPMLWRGAREGDRERSDPSLLSPFARREIAAGRNFEENPLVTGFAYVTFSLDQARRAGSCCCLRVLRLRFSLRRLLL